jgi:hypothetical protein
LIPEVRIPADFQTKVTRTRKLAKKLAPKVAELSRLAQEIRDVNDEALTSLGAAGIPLDADGVLDAVGVAIGWTSDHEDDSEEGVWNLIMSLTHDLSGGDVHGVLDTTGLTISELRRGGEADVPPGTRAMIPLPEEMGGAVVEMIVFGRPSDSGRYTLLLADDTSKRFSAPHDEVKAGIAAAA